MSSEKPFQYLYFKDGQFRINKKISGILKRLREPLHVISVVGKYRTGKSYFMNRLFKVQSEEDGGFVLGSTIQSATKGLWGWLKKIDGKQFLLIDTEGLYDPQSQGMNFDNKIISFALLLSSTFVLNTTGTIDRASICQLEFVVALTKSLKAFASKQSKISDYKVFFPNFIWLVRDFFLEMKNDDGLCLSDNQYLDEMLRVREDDSDSLDSEVQQLSRTKRYIKEMFPERRCFTLVQPVLDAHNLHKIHELKYDELDERFTKKMDKIVNYLHKNVQSKEMFGKKWTGRIFYEMSKVFVDHINSDKFLTMDTSFSSVVARNNEKIEKEAIHKYLDDMNSYIFGQKNISELKDLSKKYSVYKPKKKIRMKTSKQIKEELKQDRETIMGYLEGTDEKSSNLEELEGEDDDSDSELEKSVENSKKSTGKEDEESGDEDQFGFIVGGGGKGFPMDYEYELYPLHDTILNYCVEFLKSNVYEEQNVSLEDIKNKFFEKIVKMKQSISKKEKKQIAESSYIPAKCIGGGIFFEKYVSINIEKSEEKCKQFLKKVWKQRIDDNFELFTKLGEKGHEKYILEKNLIEDEYYKKKGMGPCKHQVFEKFIENKKQDEEKIKTMSKFILEKSKKIEQLETEIDSRMTEIQNLQKNLKLDKMKIEEEKKKQEKEKKKMEKDMAKKNKEMEEKLKKQKLEMEQKMKLEREKAKGKCCLLL